MPFVNISLARGKSGEYLEAVSRAVTTRWSRSST